MSSDLIYSADVFAPTYLYIKQHTITGKLYFGKSTRNEEGMRKYAGSGKYWKDHIKKHGKQHVITLWYQLFLNKEDMISFATQFSKQENIVASDMWANLRDETGVDGFPKGVKHKPWTNERRLAHSIQKKGKPSHCKGKSYEEIYGKDRAGQLKKAHSQAITGKSQSIEARAKNSAAHKKPQTQVTCPHCGKTGGISLMKRYHYDHCKSRYKTNSKSSHSQ